jgi:DNA repair protein RecN (Recombination protein N)
VVDDVAKISFAHHACSRQIRNWKHEMLTTLRIKNLALVADLTLELRPGYNVITGETGAGKSILIGALNLVLGERADRTLIRTGADSCSVEAAFDLGRGKLDLSSFFEENGLESGEDDQIVLKRTFTIAGTNRQFINGSPTTLSILASLGEWLVDIHGPHEHQSLIHPGRQLVILDAFGNLDAERSAFGDLVRRRGALEVEKATMVIDEKTYFQQLELLQFQTQEIAAAQLAVDEEEQTEQEYQRGSNAAKLLELSQTAIGLLGESETSLLTQATIVGRSLHELQRLDPGTTSIVTLHEQAVAFLRDLQVELSRYVDKVDLEPARLHQLEERLNLIHSLKRKYGRTLAEVIVFGEEASRKLQNLKARDVELARLNTEISKLDLEIERSGQALSSKRRTVAPQLAKAVSRQLSDLGFKQSQFEATLALREQAAVPVQSARTDGFDVIEFQFAPNPGEPLKPLRSIASSGELARLMLALKTVLANEDQVPVLVFDEVDANVGGETAHVVGQKMQQIARRRQVLCITHLPQVAAPAAAHYVVTKQIKAGRTTSEIALVEGDQQVTELARMLGGQTQAARQHAKELLAR